MFRFRPGSEAVKADGGAGTELERDDAWWGELELTFHLKAVARLLREREMRRLPIDTLCVSASNS